LERFFVSSRRRHTRSKRDWSSDVCSSDLGLFRQRKRWARGMIEAFKKVPVLTSKQMNWKSKILMLFNVLFPFVDLALLIFVPVRSEERRVGKECSYRAGRCECKRKT